MTSETLNVCLYFETKVLKIIFILFYPIYVSGELYCIFNTMKEYKEYKITDKENI